MKSIIETRQIAFPTTAEKLRQAYETLFTNDDLFAAFYRMITAYQWELWTSPSSGKFIRSDNPIVISGSPQHGSWQLVYPMTPDKCFVAGPNKRDNEPSVVPKCRQLDDSQLWSINGRIAKSARRSVIAQPIQDDSNLRMLLDSTLCGAAATPDRRDQKLPEFWGPIE